jgi:hypothetical protein
VSKKEGREKRKEKEKRTRVSLIVVSESLSFSCASPSVFSDSAIYERRKSQHTIERKGKERERRTSFFLFLYASSTLELTFAMQLRLL